MEIQSCIHVPIGLSSKDGNLSRAVARFARRPTSRFGDRKRLVCCTSATLDARIPEQHPFPPGARVGLILNTEHEVSVHNCGGTRPFILLFPTRSVIHCYRW
jgi:hypothetical protein